MQEHEDGRRRVTAMIKTERLYLREMEPDDFQALSLVLGDPETMWHYPYTFDGQHVRDWIERNMRRYRENGFGLWAVCLKETGGMIGDCGLTMQDIHGELLPEIGYHIRRDCRRKGYAGEAAKAVRDWAFRNTDHPALYSYCRYTNVPSIKTAESIGMRFACEYPDAANGTTHVSVMSREDWLNELTENMIRWAESRVGETKYAGRCLSFIEDAQEQSSGIEIFGGDSAGEPAVLYADAMRRGSPERGAFVFYDRVCRDPGGPVDRGHYGIGLGDGRVIHVWDAVRIDGHRQIEAMTAHSGDRLKYIGWVPLERVLKQRKAAEHAELY